MSRPRNWPLWAGLVLSIVAFITYPTIFVRWVLTRDVPWANFLLFAFALALLFLGVRRAARKTVPIVVVCVGVAMFAFFLLFVFVGMKMLPASPNAPRVGAKAPAFTLLDANRRAVSLDQLLATSPRGVMLIFYRGYW